MIEYNQYYFKMDSYSSSFGYNYKTNHNLSSNCIIKKTWEMDAMERAECLNDDITIIAYFILFVFYIALFSSLEIRR